MSAQASEPVAAERTADGYVYVCEVDALAPGTAAQADVDGRILAVVRDADGDFHAVDDRCTHADVSLSEGEVDGCTLECWLHGSRFDLRTGRPTGPPAIVPVAVHAVRVDDTHVYINPIASSAQEIPS